MIRFGLKSKKKTLILKSLTTKWTIEELCRWAFKIGSQKKKKFFRFTSCPD
jgi:hypothetical protein